MVRTGTGASGFHRSVHMPESSHRESFPMQDDYLHSRNVKQESSSSPSGSFPFSNTQASKHTFEIILRHIQKEHTQKLDGSLPFTHAANSLGSFWARPGFLNKCKFGGGYSLFSGAVLCRIGCLPVSPAISSRKIRTAELYVFKILPNTAQPAGISG